MKEGVASGLISITFAPRIATGSTGEPEDRQPGYTTAEVPDHQEDLGRGRARNARLRSSCRPGKGSPKPYHGRAAPVRHSGSVAEGWATGPRRSGQLAPQTVQRILQMSPCSFEDSPASRAVVQTIHILCDEG